MRRFWVLGLLGLGAIVSWKLSREAPAPQGRLLNPSEVQLYLLEAARAGDLALVAGLLEAGATPEVADDRGYTPLILAAYHGHGAVVDKLLGAGADPCRGDARGNTALMGAAFKGYSEIVEN